MAAAKPPLGRPLNFGHPIAAGLKNVWIFNATSGLVFPDSGLGPLPLTQTGNAAWTAGAGGIGELYVASSYHSIAQSIVASGSPFTLHLDFEIRSATAQSGLLSIGNTSTDGNPNLILVMGRATNRMDLYYNNTTYLTGPTLTVRRRYQATITWTTASVWSLYLDGILQVTASSGNTLGHYTTLYLGSGFGGYTDASIYATFGWTRALTATEVLLLAQNPYQIVTQTVPAWMAAPPGASGWGALLGGSRNQLVA